MIEDIYDPLNEYDKVFRERFREIAEKTFDSLVSESKIDIEANRKTCKEIQDTDQILSSVKSKISRWTFWAVVQWIIVGVGIFVAIQYYESFTEKWQFPALIALIIICFFYVILRVHPHIKKLKKERDNLSATLKELTDKAWAQMKPLNRLYDWDILTRMMTKTVPRLEFDPYFTNQRLADLKEVYNWDDSFNEGRSILYSLSGLINGNPFVLCRAKKMIMGSKTYYGSKTIYWTTREVGSDGKMHSVSHSETLTASVTADYPEYFEKARLFYGNTAAPDLKFYRKQSGMASKEGTLSYKMKRNALRRKARNLDNADYAMMTNEEFEVAFDTRNRNDNQQFALLFTPLAQQNMLNLLRDSSIGYGDDFDFEKNKMINTIISNHLQNVDFDLNPQKYHNYSFEEAKSNFINSNADYFKAIYFSLAPLLCVPMYQQIRPQHDIYGHDMMRRSAFWEHESLANFWGKSHFEASNCVTDCILKTNQLDDTTVKVTAYGYSSTERISYISKWGGDGRMHEVPVTWYEYNPVTGYGTMNLSEDNTELQEDSSQSQRIDHINSILEQTKFDVYRRHIASKVK